MLAIERLGAAVIRPVTNAVELATFFLEAIKSAFTEREYNKKIVSDVVMRQILFTGVEALKVIVIIALLIGGAVIIESFNEIPLLGDEGLVGKIMVVVIVRELGPLLTAFIIIGRSGTAISTEIGYMMVRREIEALEIMGINPLLYIVLPRLIGVAAAIFCLSFIFNVVAFFGGYLFARFIIHYPFAKYMSDISAALGFWDVGVSGIKCLLFGIIVALNCCYRGFSVQISFTEIPQMTTKAVVTSIYMCFVINILITAFFYL